MKTTTLRTLLSTVIAAGALVSMPAAQASALANGAMLNGISINGAYLNGITFNGLYLNGITFNGLRTNGLFANGLRSNGFVVNGTQLGATEAGLPAVDTIVLRDGRTLIVR